MIDYSNYLFFLPDQICRPALRRRLPPSPTCASPKWLRRPSRQGEQAGASQSGRHFFRTHVSHLPTKEKKESKNPRIFKAPEVPNRPTSDKKEKAERQKKINPVVASAKSGWLRKFSRNRTCHKNASKEEPFDKIFPFKQSCF